MTVFKYVLIRNFQKPFTLILNMVFPLAFMLFAIDIWTYAPAMGVMLLINLMLYGANLMAGVILEDRMDGSVMRILSTPVSMLNYVFQNLLAAILPWLLQILFLGLLGYFRYGWTLSFTLGLTLSFLLFAFAMTAFAFCWNMLIKSRNNMYSYMFVIAIVGVLSGTMLPLYLLPDMLQHVGAIFHPYWFVRSLTTLTLDGITRTYWLYQGVLVLFTLAFLLIGGKRRSL